MLQEMQVGGSKLISRCVCIFKGNLNRFELGCGNCME